MRLKVEHYRSLLVFVMLMFVIVNVHAQDDALETYHSPDGEFSFAYPTGWSALGAAEDDGSVFAAAVQSETDVFETGPTQVNPGERGVFWLVFPVNSFDFVLPDDIGVESLVTIMINILNADTDDPISFDTPSTIMLSSGVEAGRSNFSGGTGAGLIVVSRAGDLIVAGIVITHIDEFAEFEAFGLQIVGSFEINSAALSPLEAVPPLTDLLPSEAQTRSVIVDLDMAHEDMIALLFLLNHPRIDVRAVTVTGTGEVHCDPGVRNARALLVVSGNEGIPVACGRETPLAGDHVFPESWRGDADAAYGVTLPETSGDTEQSAVELLTTTARSTDSPLTIITLGPLTNLAEMIQNDATFAQQIEAIYIMGGAVDVHGNVAASGVGINNPAAEWNIYIDPVAANIVLQSGVPITLVPLDATVYVPISIPFVRRLAQHENSDEAGLVLDILRANSEFVVSGGFQFWDTLTSAIVTDERLATFEERAIHVIETEGANSGATRPVDDGVVVRVAISADRAHFENLLLAVLNQSQ